MKFEIDHSASGCQQYQKLFQHMLEKERIKNDGVALTEAETNQIRGRISLLKELLALPTQKILMEAQARIEHPDE